MEVHFKAETEKRLRNLASQTGRGTDQLVQDVVGGYVDELARIREMLTSRYDEQKTAWSRQWTERNSLQICDAVRTNW
jgi:predicted DNA-binding protein